MIIIDNNRVTILCSRINQQKDTIFRVLERNFEVNANWFLSREQPHGSHPCKELKLLRISERCFV